MTFGEILCCYLLRHTLQPADLDVAGQMGPFVLKQYTCRVQVFPLGKKISGKIRYLLYHMLQPADTNALIHITPLRLQQYDYCFEVFTPREFG